MVLSDNLNEMPFGPGKGVSCNEGVVFVWGLGSRSCGSDAGSEWTCQSPYLVFCSIKPGNVWKKHQEMPVNYCRNYNNYSFWKSQVKYCTLKFFHTIKLSHELIVYLWDRYKKTHRNRWVSIINAGLTRLELATSCVTGRHSNQTELQPLKKSRKI